jgi:hypothetical protein
MYYEIHGAADGENAPLVLLRKVFSVDRVVSGENAP